MEPTRLINPFAFREIKILCTVLVVLDIISASSFLEYVGFCCSKASTAISVLFRETFDETFNVTSEELSEVTFKVTSEVTL